MEKEKYISFDQIIEHGKRFGIEITWRKLNYYKTLGLLPKPLRQARQGFYPSGIAHILIIYSFLQNHLGLTLEEIRKIIDGMFKREVLDGTRIGMFAFWVDATYGFFLEMALKKMGTTYPLAMNGVSDITDVNLQYKKAIKESNFFKFSIDNLIEDARKWAKEAVKKYVPTAEGKK